MLKRKLIAKIEVAFIAVILAGTGIYASQALGTPQPSHQKLVDEVWQILDKNYVDGSFNDQDWKAVRQKYVSRSYTSKKQAYEGQVEQARATLAKDEGLVRQAIAIGIAPFPYHTQNQQRQIFLAGIFQKYQ
jgi:carboxyl-terminal processing protease